MGFVNVSEGQVELVKNVKLFAGVGGLGQTFCEGKWYRSNFLPEEIGLVKHSSGGGKSGNSFYFNVLYSQVHSVYCMNIEYSGMSYETMLPPS